MEDFEEIVKKESIVVSPVTSTDAFGFHTQDKKIYFSLFNPEAGPAWKGNLKCYKMGADGIIYDKNNNPAIDETTGFFKTTAHSFWSSSADGNNILAGGIAEHISKDRKVYSDILATSYNHYATAGTVLSDLGNKLHEDNSNLTTTMLGLTSADANRTKILQWTRGVDVDDLNENGSTTDNRATIGDPLHTKPVLVEYYPGDETIYMTTNDGFLHAVNSTNGNTIFSFIPQDLLPQLRLAYNNSIGTDKLYGLDAPMTSIRLSPVVNGNILDSAGGNVLPNSGVWLTLPMRRGGRNLYALNVSDRNNPKVEWTIRGGKTASQQTTKLNKTVTTVTEVPQNVGIADGLGSGTGSFFVETTTSVDVGIGDFTKLGQTWSIHK
jgi:type IV pilus assembly protein PilY1